MAQSISKFMTASVHTIQADATIAAARALMFEFTIRHLPVLERGALVGILSLRDIQLLESIAPKDAAALPVSEAMSQDVLTVRPEMSLSEVAAVMASRKLGSAVVQEGQTLGIFTTTDALRALATLLAEAPRKRAEPERDAPAAFGSRFTGH